MRRAAAFGGILAIAAGVWVWHSTTDDQVCHGDDRRFAEIADRGATHATVKAALASLLLDEPGFRDLLPPESLVPTDEASPAFGATLDSRRPGWREYDIWKDGVVVQGVSLLQEPGGWWGIGGYSWCEDPGDRIK
jgi:hypothetical protein